MDKVIELAKQAGAVSYTNRHYPDRPYRTFGPEELQKFYTLARADLEADNARMRQVIADLIPCMEKAFDHDDDVFRLLHNDAVDALMAAEAAMKEATNGQGN